MIKTQEEKLKKDMNQLPDGWVEVSLGGVCENISRRFDFENKEKIVFVNTGNVLNGKFLHKNYISKEGLPGQAKKAIEKGDILYSEIRPKNKRFALVDFKSDDFVVSTKFMVLKKNEKIDLSFLYLFLTSNKILKEFNATAEARSGTFPQITFDAVKHIKINLPPLAQQKSIAKVLSSFDDKIELLREQNETLEKVGEEIFKEWFGKYKVGDDLPEGWRVGKMRDICEITSGKRPENKSDQKTNSHKIPLIGATKIMGYVEDFLYNEEILIIGRVGTHGKIQRFYSKIWPSDNTLVIKSGYFNFTYFILKNIDYVVMNRGAVQPLITQTDLKNYPIIYSEQKIEEFAERIMSLFEKIKNNSEQIQTLSKTRDELLPRLMRGEVEVS